MQNIKFYLEVARQKSKVESQKSQVASSKVSKLFSGFISLFYLKDEKNNTKKLDGYRTLRLLTFALLTFLNGNAQTLTLDDVLTTIKTNNPQLKMYDADIQSMDASAKGPEVGWHHK